MTKQADHNTKKSNYTKTGMASKIDFNYIIKNNLIAETLESLAAQQNIDIYNCALNPWKALLMETGAILFANNELKIKVVTHINNNIPCYNFIYDFNKMAVLCDIYVYLSYKYNKLINVLYYGCLCNIKNNNIYTLLSSNNNYNNIECCKDFNNIKISIYKRLKNEREENLKERCFESAGAVGAIAVGNAEYYWNVSAGQKATQAIDDNIISIQQLPELKAIGRAQDPEGSDI